MDRTYRDAPARAGAGSLARQARTFAAGFALAVALLLGGGRDPTRAMAIEIFATIALALCAATFSRAEWQRTWPVWAFAGAILILAAIQLSPLPATTWQGLPGRSAVAAISATLGEPMMRRPLSLDPDATIGCLLTLLPAFAAAAAAAAAAPRERDRMRSIVVIAALASVALGLVQLATNRFYLFSIPSPGLATGLFSNRNQQPDLLLIAILFVAVRLAAARRGRDGAVTIAAAALMLVLAVAIIPTRSRAGLAMLPVVVIVSTLLIAWRGNRGLIRALLALAGIVGIAVATIMLSPVARAVIARYGGAGHDLRFEFWDNTRYAIAAYWPAGSGLGTFVPVYASVEPIDTIFWTYVNHAHNEYLELVLEAGLPGVAVALVYVALTGLAAWRWRRAEGDARSALLERGVAVAGMVLLMAHSVVDYPMRAPALMAVFGLLNGLLLARPEPRRRPRPASVSQ